jgi:bisphosphoglycerate-independent phosphoglycerate mutase (AlkP superfamily)
MSGQAVADKVASIVKSKGYDFVMYNFAPPDIVGVSFLFFVSAHAC